LKKSDVVFFLISLAAAIFFIRDAGNFMLVFLSVCAYLLYRFNRNLNVSFVFLLLAGFKLLEYSVFDYAKNAGNFVLYPTWILIDLAIVLILMFKAPLLRKFEPRQNENVYFVTRLDMLLGAIYLLHLSVNLLALAEHFLRHLDSFGLPVSNELTAFLFENARFIYHIFPYVKHTLNISEFLVIWSLLVKMSDQANAVQKSYLNKAA